MPLTADFTQQIPTAPCAHCQKHIPRIHLQEVQSEVNSRISHFLCPECCKYYEKKTLTARQNLHPQGSNSWSEKTQQVRQDTNLAQQNHEAAPPVQTVGTLPSRHLSSQDSSIHNQPPIAVQAYYNPPQYSGQLPISTIGYSTAHNQLGQQFIGQETRARQVYCPKDTFSLLIKLAYWDDIKGKIVPIPQVTEARGQVDVHIGFIELKQLGLQAITPLLLNWLSGYNLDIETLELRDKDYILIPQVPFDAVAHYCQAKSSSSQSKNLIKYKPKTKLDLYFIMACKIFKRISGYLSALEKQSDEEDTFYQPLPIASKPSTSWSSGQSIPKGKHSIVISDDENSSHSGERDGQSKFPKLTHVKSGFKIPTSSEFESMSHNLETLPSTISRENPKLSKHKTLKLPQTPESDEVIPTMKGLAFTSPDSSLLEKALKQQVEPSEASIRASSPAIEPLNIAIGILGTLDINFSKTIGKLQGSFKTAHKGKLQPTDATLSGFPWEKRLVIKRPYHTPSDPKGKRPQPTLQQYALGKELHEITQEVRCLLWGDALMEFVYEFINQQLDLRGIQSLPFKIPLLQFIRCAVIMTRSPKSYALLAKEYIEGNYIKYMDNHIPVPFEDITDPEDLYCAEFLAFAQHVQWQKTGQKVFITDFQGNGSLLTDPQILTRPDLGVNLFGQGNIAESFLNFASQHICNQFCEYFQLSQPETAPNKNEERSSGADTNEQE